MQLFQDFFDQSKQLNQAPYCKQQKLPFHIQTQKYPSILIALKIPNLPAPLHYLNLFIQLGQLNLPILHHAHAKSKNATNQIYLMSSCSAHMVGQFQCDTKEATFHLASKHIQCADHVDIYGEFPKFRKFIVSNAHNHGRHTVNWQEVTAPAGDDDCNRSSNGI